MKNILSLTVPEIKELMEPGEVILLKAVQDCNISFGSIFDGLVLIDQKDGKREERLYIHELDPNNYVLLSSKPNNMTVSFSRIELERKKTNKKVFKASLIFYIYIIRKIAFTKID